MKRTRRRFLLAGSSLLAGLAAGTSAWVAFGDSRRARFFRQMALSYSRSVPSAPVKPRPESWPDNRITLAWLGHATVLIDFYGFRILTDPVFSGRIGLDLGLGVLGAKRFVAPALSSQEIPALDLVLLSHAHMDHLDLPSLRKLPAGVSTVTARQTNDLLVNTPLKGARELGWGESARIRSRKGEVQITAFEVKHWGRRWPNGKPRGYNGYVLEREGRKLIFGGDTAFTKRFSDLRPAGPYALAIMPIAAYNPWIRNHCTPEEALEMVNQAGVEHLVPVHHLTFKLSDEPMQEPLERLQAAMEKEPERLALRQIGETFSLA